MTRPTTVATLLLVAALALTAPAAAHERHGIARGYVSTVAAIEPNVLGLSAFVVGGDDRLLLRNLSGRVLVILGYDGEPYLRFSPDGVYENVRSPATYLNRARFPQGPAPAAADAAAPPRWRRVATGTSHSWHDHRIQWMRRTPPRAVAAAPDRTHRILDWRVPGTADGRRFAIVGFLGYAPTAQPSEQMDDEGSAWVVPAAAAVGAVALVALVLDAFRRRRR